MVFCKLPVTLAAKFAIQNFEASHELWTACGRVNLPRFILSHLTFYGEKRKPTYVRDLCASTKQVLAG
jgi:hypothetical protein